MKVVLIALENQYSCFGIRSLDAYLTGQGFDIKVLFPTQPVFNAIPSNENPLLGQAMLKQILQFCRNADLIGISLFSCDFHIAKQVTHYLKAHLDTPVVWGGKHPSALPELALESADMVALGEGERPLVELLKKMTAKEPYTDVKGIWFRQGETIIKNDPGKLIRNLDEIPIPEVVSERHLVCNRDHSKLIPIDAPTVLESLPESPYTANGKSYLVMASRGCPFNCTYCFTFKSLYKKQRYVRRRSVAHVIEEIKRLIAVCGSRVNLISFADDEFLGASPEYLKEFCQRYKKEIGLRFHCLGHPNSVTEEKLEMLVDAGLFHFQMGVQTLSPATRQLYNRKETTHKVENAVNLLNRYKDRVLPTFDFIIDNPYETRNDLGKTLRAINRFPRPFSLTVFSLLYLPGTVLYYRAVADGRVDPSDTTTFSKTYGDYEKRYVNILFLLMRYNLPKVLMTILTSKPMIWFFDRPTFTFLFTYMQKLWQQRKRFINTAKQPFGGFSNR